MYKNFFLSPLISRGKQRNSQTAAVTIKRMIDMRHFLSIADINSKELSFLLDKAREIKKDPKKYADALKQKTLLMIFAKPSLRTHISFDVAMTQMGGHAIYYHIDNSTIGKKESISDTAKTISRYVDAVMARLFEHADIEDLAKHAKIPVINGLTNHEHPCQILADIMTMQEKLGKLNGKKLAYLGDGNNNVPHSLLIGCALTGMHISVASPQGEEYEAQKSVFEHAKKIAKKTGSKIETTSDAGKAAKNADVVYTDSWMSYHVPEEKKEERIQVFLPYQVNKDIMKRARKGAIFMHCLPAQHGMEVTEDVFRSRQSVVFDQAENRLHAQKALLLWLLGKI